LLNISIILINSTNKQVVYDPLDAKVIVSKLSSVGLGATLGLDRSGDDVAADLNVKHGSTLKNIAVSIRAVTDPDIFMHALLSNPSYRIQPILNALCVPKYSAPLGRMR
jgi:hypothetical protein